MKFLIADDSSFMRTMVRDIVEKEYPDAQVHEADTGEEAVTRYRELTPDVLFLDIIMPGKDGIEVLKEIKDEQCGAIIMVTAVGQDQYIEEATGLGADHYIIKPFEKQKVIEALGNALSKKES